MLSTSKRKRRSVPARAPLGDADSSGMRRSYHADQVVAGGFLHRGVRVGGYPMAVRVSSRKDRGKRARTMYVFAIVLLSLCVVGLVALHTVTGLFHLVLGAAVFVAIWAFIRSRRSKAAT